MSTVAKEETYAKNMCSFHFISSYRKEKVSDMLASETRKMEEKLELVKKMMELEKEKRSHV